QASARVLGEGCEVQGARDTTGRDDADTGLEHALGALKVRSKQHAVPGDVRVDDLPNAHGFHLHGKVEGVDVRLPDPPLDRHPTVAGVDPDHHPFATEASARFCNGLWALERNGAEDHAIDARIEKVLDGVQAANAATGLHRHVDGPHN